MPRVRLLDALLTSPCQGILAATLLHPERDWYLSELARYLQVHHATLQRELARLARVELLTSHRTGNRVYYRANTDCPVYPELRSLVSKTTGFVEVLRECLRMHESRISFAFVFGSMARGDAVSESDVDLFVVGDTTLRSLSRVLGDAELWIGRDVNAVVWSSTRFAKEVVAGGSFISSVLRGPQAWILGTRDELDAVVAGGPARTASRKNRGHRRPPRGR